MLPLVSQYERVRTGVAGIPANAETASKLPANTASEVPVRPRLDAVDMLRGLVMIVMVLDHARHFFGASGWI